MLDLSVRCDICDRDGAGGTWAEAKGHLLRARLARAGWKQVGCRDYCPECARFHVGKLAALRRDLRQLNAELSMAERRGDGMAVDRALEEIRQKRLEIERCVARRGIG